MRAPPRLLLLAALLLPVRPASLEAQDPPMAVLRDAFQARLEAVARDYEGVAGFHVVDLTVGTRYAFRDDWVFPQASAIQEPILLELFRRAGDDPDLLRRRVSALAWDHFSRLAGVTDHGTRVPLEVKRRVSGGGS